MRDSMPVKREELRAKITELVDELVKLIEGYAPLSLIGQVFMKNCMVDPEAYSEPSHEGYEVYAEYAQSLAMAVSTWGTGEPPREAQERFEECIAGVYEATQLFFMFGDKREGEAIEVAETKFFGMMRHLFMRGSSNFEHATELLLAVYQPHDEFFRKHDLLTAEEFVEFCNEVGKAVDGQTQGILGALSLFASLRTDVESKVKDNPGLTKSEAIAESRDSAKAAINALKAAMAHDAFQVSLTDSNSALIERISLAPGDNHDFLGFKMSPAWPSNNTKIQTRPLVTADGKTYCPNPVLLMRHRADILECLIRDTDESYYKRRFAKVRGVLAERLAIDHFRKILPGASFFPSAYYNIEEEGQTKHCECDGLIVYQDRLLILEVKAGSFSLASMRGAPTKMKGDVTHLVGEPHQQALRTVKYLEENSSARFEREDGTELVTLEAKAFRRLYIVNVTLADISHIAARMNSVEAMGVLGKGAWPWSVYINDLRVISELIESPGEFFLYLHRRLELNKQPAVSTVDELDYLGMFFKDGLYFEKDELKGINRFNIGSGGFTVDIDRYYDRLAGRVSSGEKPRLNVSGWYRKLCELVETSGGENSSYVAEILLSIVGDQQEQIESFAREYGARVATTGKEHTLTMVSKDGLPIFVFCVASDSLAKRIASHRSYCETKRLQVGDKNLIFVAFDGPEPQTVMFKIYEGAISDGPKALAALSEFGRIKYDEYVEQHGKPGRNQSCPCNSGRKAKRCCLS